MAPYNVPAFTLGGVEVQPLAFRLWDWDSGDGWTFDAFTWSEGDDSSFRWPQLDFALRFPGIDAFGDASFTLADASFESGVFESLIVPFTFEQIDGAWPSWDLGGFQFDLVELGGGFTANDDGSQGFGFTLGGFPRFDLFSDDGEGAENECPPQLTEFGLLPEGGLEGVFDFTPCGTWQIGPVTLGVESSTLGFSMSQNQQLALLNGQMWATMPNIDTDADPIRGTATLSVDALTGDLLEGEIELRGPQWSLGSGLDFSVASVLLNQTGLTLNGDSEMVLDGSRVATVFDAAKLDFNGDFVEGEIRITSSFAMDLALTGLDWNAQLPAAPMPEDNTLRVVMPNAVTITPDGFTLNGSGLAQLRWGDDTFDGVSIDYGDGFTFGVGPFAPLSGRMTFTYDGSEFAYYDAQDGWGLLLPDFLDQQLIPWRIGLPLEDVAFLQVRPSETGDLLINLSRDGEGWRLCTSSREDCQGLDLEVDLVLPSLAGNLDAPRIPVRFSLELDAAFNVIGGELDVTLDAPLDFSDYGLPLLLRRLHLEQDEGAFALKADADLRLPEWMSSGENGNRPCSVSLGTFSFGSGGEGQTFTAGTVYEEYEQAMEGVTPLAQCELDGGALTLTVHGAQLGFGDAPDRFAGLIRSTYLQAADADQPVSLFYGAAFGNDGWALTGSANNLAELPFGVGAFDPDPENGVLIRGSETDFAVELNGVLRFDDLFGDPLALTLREVRFGPSGPSIGTTDMGEQEFDLYGALKLRVTDLNADFDEDDVLKLAADGLLWVVPFQCATGPCRDSQAVAFEGLTIGTDGSVALAGANVELLENPIALIDGEASDPDYLAVTSMQLALETPNNAPSQLALNIGGAVSLPAPLNANQTFALRIGPGPDHVQGDQVHIPIGSGELERGDENAVEIDLGGDALIDVMAVGVNLTDLNQPAVYANATLYLGDGTSEYVQFGSQGARGTQAGLYIPATGRPVWNTTLTEVDDFTVGDLLEFSDISIGIQTGRNFAVQLGGRVGLNLSGVSSTAGWRGLTIGTNGISDWGGFMGDATFSVIDVMTLTLSTIETGKGRLDIGGGEVVQTTDYLRFGGAQLSLDGTDLSGGIGEVLYYTGNAGSGLRLRNANFQMTGAARVNASLVYGTDEDGDIELQAGGTLDIQGAGQFTFDGAFSNQNNQVSVGLFVAVEAEQGIPVIPGIVDITGIGGGVFYNPPDGTFERISRNLGFQKLEPNIETSGFAVMLYGSAQLVSGALDGKVLVTISDVASSVIAEGTAMGQGNRLQYNTALNLSYGGGRYGIDGVVSLLVDYPFVLKGEAEVSFAALKQQGQGLVWGGTANFQNFEITGGAVRADGTLMIGTDGFLLDLTVSKDFNFWVIRLDGGITGSIWYRPGQSLGAYVAIGINARLFGGAAKVRASAKGALILKANNDYLIYAAASVYVEVLWVFEGRVGIWVALENGRFDGGRGPNGAYERMIAEARGQADAMKDAMDEMAAQLEDARNETGLFDFTPQQLAEAGWGYYHRQRPGIDQDGLAAQMAGLYPVPDLVTTIKNNVMRRSGDHPQNHPGAYPTRAERAIRVINERTAEVVALAESYEAMVLEWNTELQQQMDELAALTSPVSDRTPAIIEGGTILQAPSFEVDQAKADAQVDGLAGLRTSIADLDSRYFEIYEEATSNLDQLQLLLGTSDNCFNDDMRAFTGSFSIADLGCHYTYAQEETSAYFAFAISKAWKWTDYADRRLTTYIDPMEFTAAGRLSNWVGLAYSIDREQLFDIARDHKYYVGYWRAQRHRIGPRPNNGVAGTEEGEATEQADSFREILGNYTSENAQRREAFTALLEYWYRMNLNGLKAIRDEYGELAVALEDARKVRMDELRTNHANFTGVLNRIYGLKAEMTSTLLGMAESYRGWRRNALPQDRQDIRPGVLSSSLGGFREGGVYAIPTRPIVDEIRERNYNQSVMNLLDQDITYLQTALSVPSITSIAATQNPRWMYNRLDIAWQANHPQGVAEVSFYIQNEESDDLTQQVGTAGALDGLTYSLSRTYEGQRQATVEMILRARGPAGNTASRRANFTVQLTGPTMDDDLSPIEGLAGDDTPPLTPAVNVPYNKNGIYWTNRPDQIAMTLTSADYESDIAKWEYALTTGSWLDPEYTRNWTEAFGEQVLGETNTAFYESARLGTVMRELDLEPGRFYTLKARTTNSVNLRSAVGVLDGMIRYDDSPPSAPRLISANVGSLGTLSSYVGNVRPMSPNAVPVWDANPVPTMRAPAQRSATVTWQPPADNQSGLHYQMYVLSDQADPAVAFGMDRGTVRLTSDADEVRLGASQLSYTAPKYVHVYGVNYAGSSGETLTIPVQPIDQTRPTSPIIAGKMVGNTVVIYFRKVSADPDSDLLGYQYAVGSRGGRDDFRAWPEGEMDFAVTSQRAHHTDVRARANRSRAFGVMAITVPASEIPVDTHFYVSVRAVNGQGAWSRPRSVGRFRLTATPPAAPVVGLSRDDGELRIAASQIEDATVGVSRVEYRVEDLYDPSVVLADWAEWLVFDPAVNEVGRADIAPPELWDTDRLGVRVRVRVINVAGLQSEAAAQLVDSPPRALLDVAMGPKANGREVAQLRIRGAAQPQATIAYTVRYNGETLAENTVTKRAGTPFLVTETIDLRDVLRAFPSGEMTLEAVVEYRRNGNVIKRFTRSSKVVIGREKPGNNATEPGKDAPAHTAPDGTRLVAAAISDAVVVQLQKLNPDALPQAVGLVIVDAENNAVFRGEMSLTGKESGMVEQEVKSQLVLDLLKEKPLRVIAELYYGRGTKSTSVVLEALVLSAEDPDAMRALGR
ncbi:MAG: hypothetical protein AAF730_05295 [Bacteroidota bacterium]